MRILGGRPMKMLGYNFTDVVSGKQVNNYVDTMGRHWLANGKWSWFRVARNRTRRSFSPAHHP